jgi:hypothetical protein
MYPFVGFASMIALMVVGKQMWKLIKAGLSIPMYKFMLAFLFSSIAYAVFFAYPINYVLILLNVGVSVASYSASKRLPGQERQCR